MLTLKIFLVLLPLSYSFSSSIPLDISRFDRKFRGGALNSAFDEEKQSSNSKKVQKKEESRRTGWNHNLSKNPKQTQQQEDTSTNIKTGWLHNKSSATKTKSEETQKKGSGGINKARRLLEMEKMKQKRNHRIIQPPTFHACGEDRRAVITEHVISVPLNHDQQKSNEIDFDSQERMVDVYFSVVELIKSPEEERFFQSLRTTIAAAATKNVRIREQQKRASDYKEFSKLKDAKQCCLYLQGGPGFGSPIPIAGIGLGESSSWIGAALGKGFKRIVLMDQRYVIAMKLRSETISCLNLTVLLPFSLSTNYHRGTGRYVVSTVGYNCLY